MASSQSKESQPPERTTSAVQFGSKKVWGSHDVYDAPNKSLPVAENRALIEDRLEGGGLGEFFNATSIADILARYRYSIEEELKTLIAIATDPEEKSGNRIKATDAIYRRLETAFRLNGGLTRLTAKFVPGMETETTFQMEKILTAHSRR